MSDARDDDDSDLFRTAIGPVRRLDDAPPPPRGPRPRPAARMAQADERAAMSEFRQALEAMPIGAAMCWRIASRRCR